MKTESLNAIWNIGERDFPRSDTIEAQIRFLLNYAILAPSAHNTQPWRCRINKDALEIFFDKSRALGISDPTYRQGFLSIGAFVGNFSLAAECFGFSLRLIWMPGSGEINDCLARLQLVPAKDSKTKEKDEILAALQKRHNNRFPFKMNIPIPPGEVRRLEAIGEGEDIKVFVVSNKAQLGEIASLIKIGTEFAFTDPKFRAELASYIAPHVSSRRDGIPTYTANIKFFSSFFAPLVMRRFNVGRAQAGEDQRQFEKAPAFLVFCSKTDNNLAWLKTGFFFEKAIIELTKNRIAHGINTAPIEAPLLPEVLQKILGTNFRPQMLIRIGYPTKIPKHAPRREVSDILIMK